MRSRDWAKVLAGLTLAAPAAVVAHAAAYMTEAQAAAALFPGEKVRLGWVELSKEQVAAIEKTSGERVRDRRARVWLGPAGQALFIDRVLGKHEYITYAVAVSTAGAVKGVEIMDYRETYGGQVRDARWRAQFVGKKAGDPVKVDQDIQNISGATLSSVHVTNGVRRVLDTYAVLKAKG